MNYTVNGKTYTADDGYVFCHKENETMFKKLRLAKNDRIENYDVIEEPVIEEELQGKKLSDSERIENLEKNLEQVREELELAEGCILEMGDAIYGG